MKTLEFLYQETQIHFLVNPLDKDVMVNATEMAKLFGKETRVFLKTDHAKAFIEVAERALNGAHSNVERAPNGARSDVKHQPNSVQIIDNRGHMGIYFNKRLALKFAAWLSPEFEYWVFDTIDGILFNQTKNLSEKVLLKESKKAELEVLKEAIINSNNEQALKIIELQKEISKLERQEQKAAIEFKNQLKLF